MVSNYKADYPDWAEADMSLTAMLLFCQYVQYTYFLVDRTNGRAFATVLRPSVVVVCRRL